MNISLEYQTPQNVADYMVSLLPNEVKLILEPTSGKGNIVNSIIQNRPDCVCIHPKNYFDLDPSKNFDAIIMNPPFSSKSLDITNAPIKYKDCGMKAGYWILEECMEKSDIIIALMPWFTISDSDVRLRKINNFGLKSITVLPRKTFDYARIQTCVLEMHKGYAKSTQFKIFETIKQFNK